MVSAFPSYNAPIVKSKSLPYEGVNKYIPNALLAAMAQENGIQKDTPSETTLWYVQTRVRHIWQSH